jgi:hypothetical protein
LGLPPLFAPVGSLAGCRPRPRRVVPAPGRVGPVATGGRPSEAAPSRAPGGPAARRHPVPERPAAAIAPRRPGAGGAATRPLLAIGAEPARIGLNRPTATARRVPPPGRRALPGPHGRRPTRSSARAGAASPAGAPARSSPGMTRGAGVLPVPRASR